MDGDVEVYRPQKINWRRIMNEMLKTMRKLRSNIIGNRRIQALADIVNQSAEWERAPVNTEDSNHLSEAYTSWCHICDTVNNAARFSRGKALKLFDSVHSLYESSKILSKRPGINFDEKKLSIAVAELVGFVPFMKYLAQLQQNGKTISETRNAKDCKAISMTMLDETEKSNWGVVRFLVHLNIMWCISTFNAVLEENEESHKAVKLGIKIMTPSRSEDEILQPVHSLGIIHCIRLIGEFQEHWEECKKSYYRAMRGAANYRRITNKQRCECYNIDPAVMDNDRYISSVEELSLLSFADLL
jgi:hypothetical protein